MKIRRNYGAPFQAFTLVEMLVVIAIIALLASMLLPALSKSKGAAHGVRCVGNLRQIQLATAFYVSDYSAYPAFLEFPSLARSGVIDPGEQMRWPDKLHPYIASYRTKSAYVCPGNPVQMNGGARIKGFEHPGTTGFHYDMNAIGVTILPSRTLSLGLSPVAEINREQIFLSRKESDIPKPSEMIAYGDSVPGVRLWNFSHEAFFGPSSVDPPGGEVMEEFRTGKHRDQIISRRHNGKWNIVFADGHTETQRPSVLFGTRRRIPEEEPMRRRWNHDHLLHWEELK